MKSSGAGCPLRATYRSGRISIDVSEFIEEIIEEIMDEDLIDEVKRRGLSTAGDVDIQDDVKEAWYQDDVKEAWYQLRSGRVADAISILDRLVNPKWRTANKCRAQYEQLQLKGAPGGGG